MKRSVISQRSARHLKKLAVNRPLVNSEFVWSLKVRRRSKRSAGWPMNIGTIAFWLSTRFTSLFRRSTLESRSGFASAFYAGDTKTSRLSGLRNALPTFITIFCLRLPLIEFSCSARRQKISAD